MSNDSKKPFTDSIAFMILMVVGLLVLIGAATTAVSLMQEPGQVHEGMGLAPRPRRLILEGKDETIVLAPNGKAMVRINGEDVGQPDDEDDGEEEGDGQ